MKVSEILSMKGYEVVTVAPATPLLELTRLLARKNIGAAVVVEGGSIVGVAAERDVVRAIAEKGALVLAWPVADVMCKTIEVCSPDDSIHDVMITMTTQRARHLPVISDRRMVGLISIGDVVKHRLKEIEDEAKNLRDYISDAR
jgi:CBS domain-containing protein